MAGSISLPLPQRIWHLFLIGEVILFFALSLVIGASWVVSNWIGTSINYYWADGADVGVGAFDSRIVIGRWAVYPERVRIFGPAPKETPHFFILVTAMSKRRRLPGLAPSNEFGFEYRRREQGPYVMYTLWVPHWFVFAPSLLATALSIKALRASRRKRREGHCPYCGYDLRATPDRCPECGRAVAKGEARSATADKPATPA